RGISRAVALMSSSERRPLPRSEEKTVVRRSESVSNTGEPCPLCLSGQTLRLPAGSRRPRRPPGGPDRSGVLALLRGLLPGAAGEGGLPLLLDGRDQLLPGVPGERTGGQQGLEADGVGDRVGAGRERVVDRAGEFDGAPGLQRAGLVARLLAQLVVVEVAVHADEDGALGGSAGLLDRADHGARAAGLAVAAELLGPGHLQAGVPGGAQLVLGVGDE